MHLPTARAPARRRHLPILQPRPLPPQRPHQLTRARLLPAPRRQPLRLTRVHLLRAHNLLPVHSLRPRQPAIRRRPAARPAAARWLATTRLHRRLRRMPSRLAINLLPARPAVRARLIRTLLPALPALRPAALRLQPAVTRPPLLIKQHLTSKAKRTCRHTRL